MIHEATIIQRAVISVYDKTHIIELAEALHLRGVELISTGNTAAVLKAHGLPVVTVSEYTGFPEIMNGRVKTLHPKIHGGILGRRDADADVMITHDIDDIDLVIVNLYPFQAVSRKLGASFEDIIENIDIGGPTLIRGAAKNFEWCSVLVDPTDYLPFIQELEKNEGAISEKTRFHLATKAFAHTAAYDADIADYLAQKETPPSHHKFGDTLSLHFKLKSHLRYGENPNQQGAFYQDYAPPKDSITQAIQLQGKELSFNNIADGNTALECVKRFAKPACVIVKHANPCGAATADTLNIAYDKAYACDPTSAFGGIIAVNHTLDESLLEQIFAKQFVEVIIAPQFTENAILIAKTKQNCRLLQYHHDNASLQESVTIHSVNGGVLVQTTNFDIDPKLEIVTARSPTDKEMQDLLFAWQIVKFVKSNAIVYANEGQTLGIGAGQMSRIFSTEIAALKAKEATLSLKGAVMASDAFFPFKDNIEKAHQFGISAIIQPGGSIRDKDVIECANALDIAMVFTGIRCFCH